MTEANVQSVMCAYNAVNGIPACASDDLMDKRLRRAAKLGVAPVKTIAATSAPFQISVLNGMMWPASSIDDRNPLSRTAYPGEIAIYPLLHARFLS